MESPDSYRTVAGISHGLYKEKGSKFLSVAATVSSEAGVKAILDDIRKEHNGARHHCYAFRTGDRGETWKVNDDGEPPGTAGRPILGQIRSFGITNTLVVVSRYFGGTLLGVSGLINAYKSSAMSALAAADIIDHIIMQTIEIRYPYRVMNDVMRVLKDESIIQSDHSFEMECFIKIRFRASSADSIKSRLSRIEGLTWQFLSQG